MINDKYAALRQIEYKAAMAAAIAEFKAWEASEKLNIIHTDNVTYVHKHTKSVSTTCACGTAISRGTKCDPCRLKERAEKHPPCECGEPFFARGFCRKCYYRMYNKIRKRRNGVRYGA